MHMRPSYQEGLAALKQFVQREGHARVPHGHTEGDFNLGNWVANRRKDYREGKLASERIKELEALPGWTWNARA